MWQFKYKSEFHLIYPMKSELIQIEMNPQIWNINWNKRNVFRFIFMELDLFQM